MRVRRAVIIKTTAQQQWHAVLKATNNEIVATTENRTSRSGLVRMLKRNFPDFIIVGAVMLALCCTAPLQAQDTNAAPVSPAASWITKTADYIAANGEASTGIGGTWDALAHGRMSIVANQSIGVWQPISNQTVYITMTVGHSSCMSDKTHEGLGIGFSTQVFTIGWLKKARFLLFTDLSRVQLSAGIYPDVDKAVHGDFSAKTTVSSVRLGFKF